jgi:hypothetical protein
MAQPPYWQGVGTVVQSTQLPKDLCGRARRLIGFNCDGASVGLTLLGQAAIRRFCRPPESFTDCLRTRPAAFSFVCRHRPYLVALVQQLKHEKIPDQLK